MAQHFPIGALVRVAGLDTYDGIVVGAEWREHQKSHVYTVAHPFLAPGSDAPQTVTKFWSEANLVSRSPLLCDKHGVEKLWDHRKRIVARCCPLCGPEAK